MTTNTAERRLFPWPAATVLLTVAAVLVAAGYAALRLPLVADEPDDFALMLGELKTLSGLFIHSADASDQSRLPHLVSLPLAWIFRHDLETALVAVRSLFLLFHVGYLYLSFRLLDAVAGRYAGWIYVVLLATSCYLSSFAIFGMTTSDGLFLLLHVASLYRFYLSWSGERAGGVFRHPMLLALLLGLCIASKLFGVFLLAALFLFHVLTHPSEPVRVRGAEPMRITVGGGVFLVIIATINMAVLGPQIKQVLALSAAAAYLVYIGNALICEARTDAPVVETSRLGLWIAVGLTSFNLTLVFSPIYLNLRNLVNVFSWLDKWNTGILVADSHWWDMGLIALMKFGFISAAALLIPIGVYAWKNRGRISPFAVLIAVVWIVQFIAISAVRHKVTWYPLAIFPFLYLPIVWLWTTALRAKSRRLLALSILTLSIVVGDNLWRYSYWYPYGHFDGAQYGHEYIGWNRAGLVSFEVLPLLDRFLARLRVPNDRDVVVSNRIVEVPRYQAWLNRMLASRYADRHPYLRFTDRMRQDGKPVDLVLASPVYNPGFEEHLRRSNFKRLAVLSIKRIEIVTIWTPGRS